MESIDYSVFGLEKNPFAARLETDKPGIDRYIDRIRGRELERLLGVFNNNIATGEHQRLWVLKDWRVAVENNIAVIAKFFPMIESYGYYPAYVAVPLIFSDPLAGFYSMIVDKLQADRWTQLMHNYISSRLALTDQSEKFGSWSAGDLKQKLDEKGLSWLLEQTINTSAQTQPVKSQADEAEPNGEEAKESAFDQALSDALKRKLEEWLEADSLGGVIKTATVGTIDKGQEAGYSILASGDFRVDLPAVIKFIAQKYKKTIVIIDQLEGWEALDDTERGKLLGVISEFAWNAGDHAAIVLACYDETKDQLGTHLGAGPDVRLNLEAVLWFEAKMAEDKIRELIVDFLSVSRNRIDTEPDNIKPFTDDAVRYLASKEWPDLFALTETLKNTLDYAAVKGVADIDIQILAL